MDLAQHLSLLLRSERSLRLRQMLQRAVKDGDHVLDAGCGTGLLSIWAAAAGATRVVGVDTINLDTARELARDNGVADWTEFRRGDLRDIELAEKFQVVVAMIYHNDPRRDEGQSRIAGETYRRFLAEGGEPIPDGVRYTARGFAWPDRHVSEYWREAEQECRNLEGTFGLKLGALARGIRDEVNPGRFPARRPDGLLERDAAQPLTEPTPFVTMDYRIGAVEYPSHLSLSAVTPGRLDTIIWTQQLVHRDLIIFRNESISWVDPPVDLQAGQTCVLAIDERWRRTNVMTPSIA
jgi:SAM-dependent methyltransferase